MQPEQVILNLVTNARDAMSAGSRLLIVIDRSEVSGKKLKGLWNGNTIDRVLLRVKDTGCGMDEDTIRKIFEPSFTTKPTGAGTGLGLSSAYGFVKQNEGTIEVESKIGEGTAFTVHFPYVTGTETYGSFPQIVPQKDRKHPGEYVVLAVEDESLILETVSAVLAREGHKVLTAKNGKRGA